MQDPPSGVALGIDYGTSNTVAVLRWPDGRVRPVLFDGSPLLPSAVFRAGDGTLLAGRDAVHSARRDPASYEPYPKSRAGDGVLLLGDTEVPAAQAVAATLRLVSAEAGRALGAVPDAVVLTYPAAWAAPRRGVLHEAAALAGLPAPRLVPEPVAAAAYFTSVLGHRLGPGQQLVVYDLGAGTFDVSAVRRTPDSYEVVDVDGLDSFGGLDLDEVIVQRVGAAVAGGAAETWRRLTDPQTAADRRAFRTLWDDARAAKEMLSRRSSAGLFVPLLDRDVQISREEFESAAGAKLARAAELTARLIERIGVRNDELAGIFLVGGSSRVPLAATTVHRATRVAPDALDQPETVVAEGALRTATARTAAPPPGMAPPGSTAPPGVAVPGSTAPGSTAPGMAPPGTAAPNAAVPDGAPPGIAPPGTGVPGGAPPGAAPPGTGVPGTGVPGTAVVGAGLPGGVETAGAATRPLDAGSGVAGPPGAGRDGTGTASGATGAADPAGGPEPLAGAGFASTGGEPLAAQTGTRSASAAAAGRVRWPAWRPFVGTGALGLAGMLLAGRSLVPIGFLWVLMFAGGPALVTAAAVRWVRPWLRTAPGAAAPARAPLVTGAVLLSLFGAAGCLATGMLLPSLRHGIAPWQWDPVSSVIWLVSVPLAAVAVALVRGAVAGLPAGGPLPAALPGWTGLGWPLLVALLLDVAETTLDLGLPYWGHAVLVFAALLASAVSLVRRSGDGTLAPLRRPPVLVGAILLATFGVAAALAGGSLLSVLLFGRVAASSATLLELVLPALVTVVAVVLVRRGAGPAVAAPRGTVPAPPVPTIALLVGSVPAGAVCWRIALGFPPVGVPLALVITLTLVTTAAVLLARPFPDRASGRLDRTRTGVAMLAGFGTVAVLCIGHLTLAFGDPGAGRWVVQALLLGCAPAAVLAGLGARVIRRSSRPEVVAPNGLRALLWAVGWRFAGPALVAAIAEFLAVVDVLRGTGPFVAELIATVLLGFAAVASLAVRVLADRATPYRRGPVVAALVLLAVLLPLAGLAAGMVLGDAAFDVGRSEPLPPLAIALAAGALAVGALRLLQYGLAAPQPTADPAGTTADRAGG